MSSDDDHRPPGPPYSGQPDPGQQYPTRPYPTQQRPSQPYPGQPSPTQQYPGQPYPGQPYPGQPSPTQQYPGQPSPGEPEPGQPRFLPPAAPRRRRRPGRLATVVLAVVAVLVVGGAVWAWPTAGRCEAQLDATVVQALNSPSLANFQPDLNSSHYWRCYGQSDQSMTLIGERVLARHASELLAKGVSQALAGLTGSTG
jgi:hypothetical protein